MRLGVALLQSHTVLFRLIVSPNYDVGSMPWTLSPQAEQTLQRRAPAPRLGAPILTLASHRLTFVEPYPKHLFGPIASSRQTATQMAAAALARIGEPNACKASSKSVSASLGDPDGGPRVFGYGGVAGLGSDDADLDGVVPVSPYEPVRASRGAGDGRPGAVPLVSQGGPGRPGPRVGGQCVAVARGPTDQGVPATRVPVAITAVVGESLIRVV